MQFADAINIIRCSKEKKKEKKRRNALIKKYIIKYW